MKIETVSLEKVIAELRLSSNEHSKRLISFLTELQKRRELDKEIEKCLIFRDDFKQYEEAKKKVKEFLEEMEKAHEETKNSKLFFN